MQKRTGLPYRKRGKKGGIEVHGLMKGKGRLAAQKRASCPQKELEASSGGNEADLTGEIVQEQGVRQVPGSSWQAKKRAEKRVRGRQRASRMGRGRQFLADGKKKNVQPRAEGGDLSLNATRETA